MNPLKRVIKDYIFSPSLRLLKDLKTNTTEKVITPSANFLFEHSNEVALMLVIGNAFSAISGHLAQIGGLKRSKRENKDYLIKQERVELFCDIPLAVVIPVWLTHKLKLKFYSGQWTTKSSLNKMVKELAPAAGLSKKDLYNVDYIRPFKETFSKTGKNLIDFLNKKFPNMPKTLSNILTNVSNVLSKKLPDPNSFIPGPTLDEITIEEVARCNNKSFKNFYNGNAYDEFCGQFNGLISLSTIGYTIIATSVVTAIIRNLLANYFSKKQLKKMGETPESLARKKRFKYTENPIKQNTQIYTPFLDYDNSLQYKDVQIDDKTSRIFSDFNTFTAKSGNMKI